MLSPTAIHRARLLLRLCVCVALFSRSLLADSLEDTVLQMGDESYLQREAAMKSLVQQTSNNADAVILALLRAEKHTDPEIRARASTTLQYVFLRLEIGKGAPEHGLTFKSKLVTVQKKIRTRPMIDTIKKGSASSKSDLEKGDIILSINDQPFNGEDGTKLLLTFLNKQPEGAELKVAFARKVDGKKVIKKTTFHLGKADKDINFTAKEETAYKLWKARNLKKIK
ncbi:MAG: PDZ domain-containing protein [Akkermansiaceae bacterium]